MSDYDGVQVSGQRDAGKCSAVQLVTVTPIYIYIYTHTHIYIYIYVCVCVCLMKAFKPIHFFFTSFFYEAISYVAAC